MEILAPAGSMESLKAGILNNANAVYLSGEKFGARSYAINFSNEELEEAIVYAHERNVKIYVTINTLIKEKEIKDLRDYIKFLYDIQVDALIVQDIGVFKIIKNLYPDFEVHASTQMHNHSFYDFKYLNDLGFKRAVAAREMSYKEIKKIKEELDIEVEVFVHGALCMSYSGQCLMSSFLGDRSGNRGKCAQPCRRKYILKDKENIIDNGYLLSLKDLNTVEHVQKLKEIHVDSLKIEGRMKKSEYVSNSVRTYCDALNSKISDMDLAIYNMKSIFNRDFTKGFLFEDKKKDVINKEKPSNKGVYIGQVMSFNKKTKKLKIKLESTLKKNDSLNISTTVGRILKGKDIKTIAKKGEIIEIDYLNDVNRGFKLYKTKDQELLDYEQSTFENENIKIPLKFFVKVEIGKKAVLKVIDERNNEIEVESSSNVEKALKVSITEEKIKTQLSKLNDTCYFIKNLEISLDDDASIRIKELNELRRNAISKLKEKRAEVKRVIDKFNIDINKESSKEIIKRDNKIRIKLMNLEQLNNLLENINKEFIKYIDLIYFMNLKEYKKAVDLANKYDIKLIYSPHNVIIDYDKIFNLIKEDNINITTIGLLSRAKNNELNIDKSIQTFNKEGIKALKNLGANTICLSSELNRNEIEDLTKDDYDMNFEYTIYSNEQMMILKYCLLSSVYECTNCKKQIYRLENEDKEDFYLYINENCNNIIYNSKKTFLIEEIEELMNLNINTFRLEFLYEREIGKIVNNIIEYIYYTKDEKLLKELKNKYIEDEIIKGHFYKGVK
ncbi:U32 family peptidase [Peptostreptococcaceae bacterium AGR-M142]